jgi:hypothetical protein
LFFASGRQVTGNILALVRPVASIIFNSVSHVFYVLLFVKEVSVHINKPG